MADEFGGIPVDQSETDEFGGVPVDSSSAAPAPKGAPQQPTGGIGRNIRAGATEAITGIPSAILDPASHVVDALLPFLPENTAPEDSTAYALGAGRKNTNPIPPGSITHSLNKGLGLIGLNPEDVTADTPAERIARTAGAGATAVLFPEGGAEAVGEQLAARAASRLPQRVIPRAANTPLATAARKTVTGASAGLGAGTAGEAVPDSMPELKTPVEILTGIAMGAAAEAPSLVRAGAQGVKRIAAPLTERGQQQTAADLIRNRATNPTLLASQLDKPQPDLVLGSKPTTFQQIGDMGIGSLEREQATKNPQLFATRRADQNQARQNALASIQQDGDPAAVGTFLRGQFRNFDDQTQQHIDALTAHAQQQTEGLGGSGHPEEHGAALRSALQDAENSARARERGLWKAVDPDNSIRIDASPTFTAAQDIEGNMSRFAKPMDGEEAAIHETLQGTPQLSLGELADLRSRVSTAARNELAQNGNSPAYARLIRLRGAIQNNLADAAAGKAVQDAKAVAAGTMAPQQTLTGKIQGWVNDFYGQRAAQSGATGGEGAGAGAAGRSSSLGGTDGTGVPAEGGSASAAGAEGVPESAQPFDQTAAERLSAATQATKERAGTFNQPPIKSSLAKAGMQDIYKLPEARVPEKFFHTGPTSYQDIQTLRQTIGDQAALPILRDYAAASLRRAAERPDGTLDPRRVAAWQQKYGNALRAFPDLSQRFSNAASASDAIAETVASRSEAIADRNASALGKVMKAENPEDMTKTIGSMFGRNDSTKAFQDLAAAASKSPEAMDGLRQAVANHITSKFISNTEAGISGANLFKADAFQSFLKQNRRALAAVFKPEEMATLDAIAADLRRANRSITAVKLPGGSNSAQDLYGIVAHDPNATILDRALSEAGAAGAGAMVGHAAGAGVGWLGARIVNAARAAGMQKVDDLVTRAMLDPDFARDLLRKAPAKIDGRQSVKLAARLRRIGLGIMMAKMASPKQSGYAHGGKTKQTLQSAGQSAIQRRT